MKVKLKIFYDDSWRWADTICGAVLLISAVGYAFTNKSWLLVGVALVMGSLFGWMAEQEWRAHLHKERDDDG